MKVGNEEMKGSSELCPVPPTPPASSQILLTEGWDKGQGGRVTLGADSELAHSLGSASVVPLLVFLALYSLASSYLPGI